MSVPDYDALSDEELDDLWDIEFEFRGTTARKRETNKIASRRRRERLKAAGGSHSQMEIGKLYMRQWGKCHYCHRPMCRQYNVDHIIPVARGGSDSIANIALACRECNEHKGNKTPEEWFEYLCVTQAEYIELMTKLHSDLLANHSAIHPFGWGW